MELGHQNQWMLPFRLIEKNRALTGESISDCNPAPPRSNPKFNIFTFFNLNTEIKVTYLLFDFEKNENKTNSGVEIGKFFSFKRTLFYVSGQLERFGFDATWRIVRKGRPSVVVVVVVWQICIFRCRNAPSLKSHFFVFVVRYSQFSSVHLGHLCTHHQEK